MTKIHTLAALETYQKNLTKTNNASFTLLICVGTSCLSSGANEIADAFKDIIHKKDLNAQLAIRPVGCLRFCGIGPIVVVENDDVAYVNVQASDVAEIVESHILQEKIVERLIYTQPHDEKKIKALQDIGFYQKQVRIALRNCGEINPEDIDEYIANDGYLALAKALSEQKPNDVVQEIRKSGLRGRGGGGFPTGLKWQFCAAAPGEEKYMICNADEGDPGAFMDRSLIEGDPHSLLEAMIIGGYAIGANTGLIYIRAEYESSLAPLYKAIKDAKTYGFLGQNIFDSGFDFDIEVKIGAGAFVCGEETALIHSMEGNRGEPSKKPPFPAEYGFRGKPSNVNNVETFANIPAILLNGADWFNRYGTKNSKGTKVFALAGNIRNIGLVEVPMGTTFREIIFEIGGGHPEGKEIKAVQIGGPSGGVITEAFFDTPIDYDSLQSIGAMMGSGGMIVMDEDNDMVEIAKFYLDFTQDESCGKCTPCRIGTKRMYEILERLVNMAGKPEDLDTLKTLCQNIRNASLCGLGQSAPNPVLSTMKYFYKEYEDYAYQRKNKAYTIDPDTCIGCTKCKKVCPVDCIEGKIKDTHVIDQDTCIACGACYEACPVDAILKP